MRRAIGQIVSIGFRAWPAGAAAMLPLFVVSRLLQGPLLALSLGFVVNGITHRRVEPAWAAVLAACILGDRPIATLGDWLQEIMSFRAAQEATRRLVRACVSAPGVEHLESPEWADRLEVARTKAWVPFAVFGNIAALVSALLALGIALVALAGIHPALVLVVAGVVPAAHLQAVALRRQFETEEATAARWRHCHELVRLVTDASAAKETRMLGLLPHLVDRYRAVTGDALRDLGRARLGPVRMAAVGALLKGASMFGGVLVIARLAARGRVSAGEIVMGVAMLQAVVEVAYSTTSKAARTVETALVGRTYLWLLDYRSPVVSGSAWPGPGTIAFENVTFTYPGTSSPVLRDVTLTFTPGTTVAIVGDNGAGKSTLVKLLVRLYDPDEGRVTVDGIDLRDLDVDAWRERLSGAFQDFAKLHLTVREAVGLERTDVDAAIARAGANDLVASLPHGLDTQLGRELPEGVELSEGQWQKVALARGFVRERPDLLVLDEPTASLDARAEHDLFERYARGEAGMTLLVSHRFSTVRMADHIVVLDAGRVVEQGTHDDLLARQGLYAELYELQASAYR